MRAGLTRLGVPARLRRRVGRRAGREAGRPAADRRGPGRREGNRLLTDFIPPEGVPIRFELANLSARAVAQLADIVLTLAALCALLAALFFADILPLQGLVGVAALLFFAIRVPYYVLCEMLLNGQTIGKRLSGLRVISADGRTLSAHAVTVRNMLKEAEVFVPGSMLLAATDLAPWTAIALLIWILTLLAVPLGNKRRQRLGDILAGTYVVALPKPVLLPDLASPGDPAHAGSLGGSAPTPKTYAFQTHHLDHYGRYELQTLESLLQVVPPDRNRAAQIRHAENLATVSQTIAQRIGYPDKIPGASAEAFLRAFYRTQRAYLESRRMFGDARENKFHKTDQTTSPDSDPDNA